MKYSVIVTLILIAITSCTTRFFVVRHAEKADNGDDPGLSEAGRSRAGALKSILLKERIDTIFVSSKKRTQETADPLASLLVKRYHIYPATRQGNEELIRQLKSIRGNKNVLVVGHSNTVPVVVDSLMTDPQKITIGENDYNKLYIVSVKRFPITRKKLDIRFYGQATP